MVVGWILTEKQGEVPVNSNRCTEISQGGLEKGKKCCVEFAQTHNQPAHALLCGFGGISALAKFPQTLA